MTIITQLPARPVLAASIALFRGGNVLLIRRAKPPALGLYSLPGGRVEHGETLTEAALRELDEEVGLKARMIGFVDHVEHIERDETGMVTAHAVIATFAAHWQKGEAIASDEVEDPCWVNPFVPGNRVMTHHLPTLLVKAAALAGLKG